jgi:hypothetical protein
MNRRSRLVLRVTHPHGGRTYALVDQIDLNVRGYLDYPRADVSALFDADPAILACRQRLRSLNR